MWSWLLSGPAIATATVKVIGCTGLPNFSTNSRSSVEMTPSRINLYLWWVKDSILSKNEIKVHCAYRQNSTEETCVDHICNFRMH
jgi:hypothetical protein